MWKKFVVFFVATLLSSFSYAGLVLGTGLSSVTGGRTVPELHLGIDTPSFATTIGLVGVKNSVYYHSGYTAAIYFQGDVGEYGWAKVRGGFGAGVHFAERGYKDGTIDEKKSDFAFGPTLRVTWEFIPLMFVGIEGFYGLGVNNFLLVSQSINSIVFGVRF